MLGLMPFGEIIGAKLPRKSKLPVILGFSFLLGVGATFAEPAIAVLKAAGAGVIPSKAPLLYSLLNEFSDQLVYCVGAGVGVAVLLGVLRFLYGWSLKIFIVPLVLILSTFTIWAHMNEVLSPIIGKRDARVTIPNPAELESPVLTTRQTPIPNASTKGTVTGPVVTAPQSHANPIMG